MNNMKKPYRFFGIGVLAFSLVASGALATAQESAPAKPPQKPSAVRQQAKIVVVDKNKKALVVDIKGKIYRFKLSSKLKIRKEGKNATIEELLVGQQITLETVNVTEGGFEIIGVNIEASPAESEAAGAGTTTVDAPPLNAPPFQPPPANRPPISPFN